MNVVNDYALRAYREKILLLENEISSLKSECESLKSENESLRIKTAITLGVGDGSGKLFVHGDYDSIKSCQSKLIERDALKARIDGGIRVEVSDTGNIFQYCNSELHNATVVIDEGVSHD